MAVAHGQGPMLVLAGAGSGKTTVMVARTGRLIAESKCRADQLCVLTFTNKAARELKERVALRLGPSAKGLTAGTFHSLGLRLLKDNHQKAKLPRDFAVLDAGDCTAMVREILRTLNVAGKDSFDAETVLQLVQEWRQGLLLAGRELSEDQLRRWLDQHPLSGTSEVAQYAEVALMVAPRFWRRLEVSGSVDFDLLLLRPLQMAKENPDLAESWRHRFTYMMVDEFQDTSESQMEFLQMFVSTERNLMVVGDDDQAIYEWRGARVRNILDFPKKFAPCETLRLERNYRSSEKILDLANWVISKNRDRHGKVLKASGSKKASSEKAEAFVFADEAEEVQFVVNEIKLLHQQGASWKSFAVLYRSNGQSALLETELARQRIPFQVSGGTSFLERREIKDVLAYLRLSLSWQDVPTRRIINVPHRGIGDTTLEKLLAHSLEHSVNFSKLVQNPEGVGLPERSQHSLEEFVAALQQWREVLFPTGPVGASFGARMLQGLEKLGYRQHLQSQTKDPKQSQARWAWMEILAQILDREMATGQDPKVTLREFLDRLQLRDVEDANQDSNQVNLMTLHACKGLEFDVVFLVGIEEDLLPHKSLGSNVNEERRLFYVGITRARHRLFLSWCRARTRFGKARPVLPSRFVQEVPSELLQVFPEGVRPVSGLAREQMLQQMLSRLDHKISQSSQS